MTIHEALRREPVILVVGREQSTSELVRAVIEDIAGWTTTAARDLPGAHSLAQQGVADAVVFEVNPTARADVEALARLPDDDDTAPPIIVISTDTGHPAIFETLQRGRVAGFLSMPFENIENLIEGVRDAMAHHHTDHHGHRAR